VGQRLSHLYDKGGVLDHHPFDGGKEGGSSRGQALFRDKAGPPFPILKLDWEKGEGKPLTTEKKGERMEKTRLHTLFMRGRVLSITDG